ncbi:MAG: glycosyltransferase family 1 protein [Firmicutes bacterium HGW-Firmicutes-12]|nr:MAG: glycosyltransferase family 1 protein [Firmicutes bacterium HGW-Firmicutes-12]
MNVKRKALVVTTVASTIDQFCMNDISLLLEDYNVQVAANFTRGNNTSKERINEFENELSNKNIVINEIEFDRNPLSKGNLTAYKKLKKIMYLNEFDLIHCHTPIAAMFTRLAAKELRKNGVRVIYTAHGLHFYKGAPLLNWLVYYTVEKWLARYTDILITINKEDYERAKNRFKAKRVEYIPGVGIDLKKFNTIEIDIDLKRSELCLPKDAFVVLSVGELNKNKNHEVVIKAIAKMNNLDIHYVICGQGQLNEYLCDLSIKLGIENRVHLVGFRKDIPQIYKISDLFVLPSLREGLSVALMEAMANGLPVVCSKIRGNTDLIDLEMGGYLVNAKSQIEFKDKIELMFKDRNERISMGNYNLNKIKDYDEVKTLEQLRRVYLIK